MEQEYRLVKSRVGLAREWLEVKHDENFGDALEEETIDTEATLKLPAQVSLEFSKPGQKPKIEVISSVDAEEPTEIETENELERRRRRIRELEASGVDLTEEELVRLLGVSPASDSGASGELAAEDAGVVEIVEHHKPDGTVETTLTPKGGAFAKPAKISKKTAAAPFVVERTDEEDDKDKVVMTGIMGRSTATQPETDEPPKRVSKFKAMQNQNR